MKEKVALVQGFWSVALLITEVLVVNMCVPKLFYSFNCTVSFELIC